MTEPLVTHDFVNGGLDAAIAFFRRTRNELRGLPEIIPVLKSFDTPFNQELIHLPITGPYKEFKTGRRYPWAAERVM